jgi:hypothetical protein
MIETSNEIKHISAALLKFQGAVDGVGKNSKNPAFKSRYANLENVVDTARPELQAVGIVFMQSGGAIVEGVMAMSTRLIHVESGEWIQGTMDIALGKRDPQGVGSAQTYAQRYHLMAMLGLPPVDDDGEAAMDRTNSRPEPAPQFAEQPDPMANTAAKKHWKTISDEMFACTTLKQLQGAWGRHAPVFRTLPESLQRELLTFKDELKDKLMAMEEAKATSAVPPNFDNLETVQ